MSEKIKINWNDFDVNSKIVALKIIEKGLHNLPILSIARGGLLPGLIINHQLKHRYMDVIQVQSYDTNHTQHKIKILQEPNDRYNAVIIVDDLVESGNTLNAVKNYLIQKNSKVQIYTAVVYSKNESYKVDFKAKDMDPNTWIVFPYECD